jgi:hypothetical protein
MLKQSICVLAIMAASLPAFANDDIAPELKKGQPAKVKLLIDRIFICEHLAGEAGGDKQAMKELAASMRQQRCGRVDADEAQMVRQYRANQNVIAALAAAHAAPQQVDVDP